MTFRDLVLQALPYRRPLLLAGALTLLESACALTIPWLAGRVAEGLFLRAFSPDLLLFLLLLLFGLQALLRAGNNLVSGKLALQIDADLRIRLYDHIQALPLRFFGLRKQGDVLALLTHEVDLLAAFLGRTLLYAPAALLTAGGAVVLLLLLDLRLGLLVAVLIPLFYLLLRLLGRSIRPLSRDWQAEYAALVAMLDENLALLPVIKSFTREAHASSRHGDRTRKLLDLGLRQNAVHAVLEPLLQFLAAAAVIALLWLAAGRVGTAAMSPGEVIGFLLYAVLLTRPMSALASLYGQVQTTRGALSRLGEVLSEAREPAGGLRPGTPARGSLRFEDVSFAYAGGKPVLQHLDLEVAAGERVAITGRNGSGKSTLLQLLLAFRTPDAGRIFLDGHDLAGLDLHWLRQQIAVVSQQVLLFDGSIRDNIRFARLEAEDREVEAAARVAQLHDFVASLPEGYDTQVGEGGLRLSGGQRQRLALARAMLKNAAVLVLDEATAMFDPEGEQALVAAAECAFAGRTVVLVTHRTRSLSLAGRILELEAGRLHEVPAQMRADNSGREGVHAKS